MIKSNFSKAGIVFGFLFSLLSAIRYFAMYPDLDKALVYVLIGAVIIAISYLYNEILEIRNTLIALENYLADKEEEVK